MDYLNKFSNEELNVIDEKSWMIGLICKRLLFHDIKYNALTLLSNNRNCPCNF